MSDDGAETLGWSLHDVDGRGTDILVVDDAPTNFVAIEAALGDLGRRVVCASSGPEALQLLLERDFALILLDVQMPGMDGFETARRIRERKRSRHIPIIFVTGFDRSDRDVLDAYRLGAVDFLFKPVEPDVLRAKAATFVALQERTAEVLRQAALLREHERHAHEEELEKERRRLEADFLRAEMQELGAADRCKDEFLAMLGHELRTPLAAIVAGLEMMRIKQAQSASADDTLHRTREMIERQVRHLTRLVDDLLDVSRLRSGKIELLKSPVLFGRIVEDAVSTAQPLIEARHHELTLTLPTEPILLEADPVRLSQVFANLLTNAAKYTDPGGRIDLIAAREDQELRVRVLDNGRGIAPAMLSSVFDLFVQERSGSEGGLGLGLAVVRRLTEMHGGAVSVTSAGPGCGSEFTVTLPVRTPAAETADPIAAPALPHRMPANLSIALVEDDADIRETLVELLATRQYKVQAAEDGARGADLILSLLPDVAFVDIGLPDIDGYEVAQRVRARDSATGIRLVALTGRGQELDRQRAARAGFDGYLVKPVGLEALEAILIFGKRAPEPAEVNASLSGTAEKSSA